MEGVGESSSVCVCGLRRAHREQISTRAGSPLGAEAPKNDPARRGGETKTKTELAIVLSLQYHLLEPLCLREIKV